MYLGLSPAIVAKQEFDGERQFPAAPPSPGILARILCWLKHLATG